MTIAYDLDRAGDQPLPPAYAWCATAPTGLTYTDIFCGAGGSSLGMTAAGLELVLAANHSQRAIETHSSNFTRAEHLLADINNYDMRRLPRTDILWASPICTETSPAGGHRRKKRGQTELELFGPIAQAEYERTRATFHDVIRATEVHRYRAVLVENVVEVAVVWELFDWWVEGMCRLGYEVQYVSVSAAHIGGGSNDHAPQWRDRLYLVFTRKGAPLPDVDPRPLAWCDECAQDVAAIQAWKKAGRRIGKYRQQYVYRCPNTSCRHAVVEPYVLPAAAAIDWTDLGTRVGDRKKPLAEKTRARIEAGLRMFAQPIHLEAAGNTFERRPGVRTWPAYEAPLTTQTTTSTKALAVPPMTVPAGGTWRDTASPVDVPMGARTARETDALVVPPVMLSVNHDGDDGRAYPADAAPLPSRTLRIGDGLAVAPFVTELRGGGSTARPVADPLATITANGNHHMLTVPPGQEQAFYVKNYGGNAQPRDLARPVSEPLGTITVRDSTSLVIPYRRGARPYPPGEAPLSTVATHEQHGLARLGFDVDDCRFRMLKPREHLRAQRFPDLYVVTGNIGEQTMQAGNAVAANVAQWLGAAVAAALCGEAA